MAHNKMRRLELRLDGKLNTILFDSAQQDLRAIKPKVPFQEQNRLGKVQGREFLKLPGKLRATMSSESL